MPHVDFFILPDDQLQSLQLYACKLAESNWLAGKRVLLQTDNQQQSQQLDELLWNLREDSFIPHAIATLETSDQQQPVLISHQKLNDADFQHVINLSSRPCDLVVEVASFNIDEILNQEEQRKQSGRENYKIYRNLGYTLKHHTLEPVGE